MADKYFEGIGRRKTSSARVRIYTGKKTNVINEKPVEEYVPTKADQVDIVHPLVLVGLDDKYYFSAKVSGGGVTGQKGAIQLGIARALVKMDPTLKPVLRKNGFMTRDPRMVERKKYGKKKARKKPQFSKR